MEVVGAEAGVALGTLALPRLVARAQTLQTEDVEALDQHRVLAVDLARGTRQLLLGMTGTHKTTWSSQLHMNVFKVEVT